MVGKFTGACGLTTIMARPKKYELSEVIPIIKEAVKNKESKVDIAKRLNVSRNTLHYWIKNHPELKDLFKQ